jgi:hypothetical protein
MEIVLLWLDELDDLVAAGISRWRPLSGLVVAVSLAAAVGVSLLA